MTHCFEDSERLVRALVAFREDLDLLRSIRAPYWRAQGAVSLVERALSLEHQLLRSPPHELRIGMEELYHALKFSWAPTVALQENLGRLLAARRAGGVWLRRLRGWLAGFFEANPVKRAAAVRIFSPRGCADPFLEDLSDPERKSMFSSDLTLLCALLDQGLLDDAREALPRLDPRDRSEAEARIAVASVLRGVPAADVWNFHGIREKNERERARLAVLVALQEQGDTSGAVDALASLEGRSARVTGAGVLAEKLRHSGQHEQAWALLESFDDGGPRGLILRAQWRLDDSVRSPSRAFRFAAGMLDEASNQLPILRRGERGALWDASLPGRSSRSLRVTLELLRTELELRRDPSWTFSLGFARMTPVLRALLVRSDACGSWWAARLRFVEVARGKAMIRPEERSSAADRGRALLLKAQSESLTRRSTEISEARALIDGVRGGGWDEVRRSGRYGDATSPLRAAFDEGVSLGPERERRRRALTQVCRRVLLDGQRGQGSASRGTLESRVRCLVQLGDPPASAILQEVLEATTSGGRCTLALLVALSKLAPTKAQALVFTRFEPLMNSAGPYFLENLGVLPENFLHVLGRLQAHLWRFHDASPREQSSWIGQLFSGWWSKHHAAPPVELLSALLAELSGEPGRPLPEPGSLLDRLLALSGEVAALPPDHLLRELASEEGAASTLAMLALSGFPEQEPRWPLESWRRVARRLLGEIGTVSPSLVHRWCRELTPGKQEHKVALALLHGEAPTPLPRELPLGRGYHLCWLEKGRDLLAFLRFADCVPNCMNSTSSSYRSSMDTQRSVLALWKDPFSFCFRVQHQLRSGDVRPEGFVFGSFGLSEGGAVLLLNGIYLRRTMLMLRKEILAQIEEQLARPLGVKWVGIASRYGGRGELPEGYKLNQDITVRRLRALIEGNGTLARQAYDDLGIEPNREARSPRHIYWRSLA